MAAPRLIRIVGGGPAGLTLGIALRQRDIPVSVFEAGQYPRHRVCGEFISGRGLETLDELGLKPAFLRAGAIEASTAAFFPGHAGAPHRPLPVPALCLSRFAMDKLLADEFQKLGGDLHTGQRWENGFGEGIVRASGRRPHPVENGWRCFGLKVHAREVALEADLEMHIGRNSYVGLCRLTRGQVNICGLFRRHGAHEGAPAGFDLLRGEPGSVLHDRLARAEFDVVSCCSVAGLMLRPERSREKSECNIGDALAMIPPVTGNGMSIAFESAQLAAAPLATFARGGLDWARACDEIHCLYDKHFSARLRWAQRLHEAMFSPRLQPLLLGLLARGDSFWRLAFARTR